MVIHFNFDSGDFHCKQMALPSDNARERVKWEDVLEELKNEDLIKDEGYKGESFLVTAKDYILADLIN